MRILYLTNCFDIGGTELYTLDYATEMQSKGHTVFWGTVKTGKMKAKAEESGIALRFCVHASRTPVNMISSVKKIKAVIEKENIEIVHAIDAYTAMLATFAIKKLNRKPKLVWSNVGIGAGTYSLMKKLCAGSLDMTVAVSHFIRNRLIESGFNPYKIIVYSQSREMAQPTVTREAWRKEHSIDADAVVIGSVGRVVDMKGNETLVRVMPAIAEHYSNARLVIVGDGPDKARLEQLAKELKVEDKIIFTGALTNIENIYNAFDIVAFPTYWEALGYIPYEAMYYEKPLVASYTGGVPEIVKDGYNGLLVPPADLKGWEEALLRLLGDKELCESLSENGKEYYNNNLSRQARKITMENYYSDLLR